MKINFGNTLQSILNYRNLTQKEMSDILHISPQALNSYIKNKRVPDMETMRYILQCLQLDANIVLQIKLENPRVYVTDIEQRMLEGFRQMTKKEQELFVLILTTIVSNKLHMK